jgi:Mannosyltransferase (PIG-V)
VHPYTAAPVEAASDPIDIDQDQTIGFSRLTDLELTGDGTAAVLDPPAPLPGTRRAVRSRPRTRAPWRLKVSARARQELLWITVIYIAARAVLVLAAYLEGRFGHHSILTEFANWDGLWYRKLANDGYPRQVSHEQTTLGFFPLFPISIWLLTPVIELVSSWQQIWASTMAGVLISGVGGWVATVFVHRLTDGWWGRDVARRATVLFILTPGAVVFSMVYSEALLLPLAAICIWALERRKWWVAGLAACFGGAVQPVGLVLAPVCASAALVELWRHGWRSGEFRASIKAPLLSVVGAASFMGFMWAWAGNPMATYIAQHHGWGEKTNLLAVVDTVERMAPAFDPSHFNHPTIDLNLVFGTIGAVIMVVELVLLWFYRRELSLPAIVWTVAIIFLALTSEYTPPNPRMLLTAFPGLVLFARYLRGRSFNILVAVNLVLFVVLSLLTFVGYSMRP